MGVPYLLQHYSQQPGIESHLSVYPLVNVENVVRIDNGILLSHKKMKPRHLRVLWK